VPLFGRPKHIPTSSIYPLQYRKIWKKLLTLEVTATAQGRKLWRQVFGSVLALGGVAILIGVSTPGRDAASVTGFLAPFLGMFATLVFAVVAYEWLYIWTYYYDVGESFLKIRKGVIIRREITVPYGRIQDVYVDQDLMDHLFHLYDLYISTATEMSGLEAHVDGLNRQNAEKVRDLILGRVQAANATSPGQGSGGL
jgi:membrane protein YdbS with pleckstrin-like domain